MSNKNKDLKKLHAAAAAYIVGKKTNVRIEGSPERVQATTRVIHATKELYEGLKDKDRSLNEISVLLDKKRDEQANFTKVTGLLWLL